MIRGHRNLRVVGRPHRAVGVAHAACLRTGEGASRLIFLRPFLRAALGAPLFSFFAAISAIRFANEPSGRTIEGANLCHNLALQFEVVAFLLRWQLEGMGLQKKMVKLYNTFNEF